MNQLPQAILEVLREKRKITVEEYMQLPETNIHMELIDGELLVYDGQEGNMPAPKDVHQEVSMTILAFLLRHFHPRQLRSAPTDIHLALGMVVQPDIFWINPDNDQCVLMDDGYLHGAPDFVVEILSPKTSAKDRGTKFDLYEQHGVGEYWIVDPEEQFIEVYIRQDGFLRRQGLYDSTQAFTSKTLNVPVNLADLFASYLHHKEK
ncbi:MAG: Uma2 family endonuclease [Phototrophicales bacterium]|nr:Uma2 family endonuclease [Phototrophicales bacterium]